ncbi:phage tail tape measure protein [Lysinibacillus sp. RC79]|uniref:phage tail tape measure protein n=1 Tax=Lysinibacillus sp. RC79 TaxID=3156296 RepID=UPI003511C25D
MSKRIKGITIELDGETKGLDRALSEVNKRSKDIQKELREVDKLLKFNPKNVELLAQKKKLLAEQVENTRKKLDQLKQTQEQVTQAFKEGKISEDQYRAFQREIAETESKLKHYEGQLKSVDATHRSFSEKVAHAGKSVKELGQSMSNVGRELSMKVTAPLMAIGGVAAKIGMDFKAGLSEVQAISGATAAEVGKLEVKARELGSSTKFSAKQVTEGFKYMALAGWDVKQSMDGIDGVLNLAAASGEDLALVSDILTDAISAFGDKASDATRYADVLAATASNANTDVAGLGEAFKYVAPVAGALGYSLEHTSAALGLMANAGVKGSAAGTALRGSLTNLAKPTKEMQKAMDKLGISIKDSNGEMKPLDVLLQDMRGSFKNLTADQKASYAATIFGKEAMAGMLAVLNASEADFNKLSSAINNSEGKAKEMAEVMQNNLAGSLTNLKSALEELAIKIFDALEPALTWLVGAAQDLVDWMNGLDASTQRVIVVIAGLVAALGPLLVVGGGLLTGLGMLMTSLPALVPLIGAIAGPVGIVVGVVAALGAAYALTRTKADEQLRTDKELADNNLKLAETHSKVLEEKSADIDKTTELAEKTIKQAENVDKLTNSFEGLWDKSKLSREEFAEFLDLQTELENTTAPKRVEELEKRMDALREKSGLSNEEFNELLSSNKSLVELFPQAGEAVGEYGNRIADTTGKLRDMTQAELARMEVEVYNKMISDLEAVNAEIENYETLLGEVVALEESVNEKIAERNNIQKDIADNEATIIANNEKIAEIKERQKEASFKENIELGNQKEELKLQNYQLDKKNDKNKENLEVVNDTLSIEQKTLKEKQNQSSSTGELITKNRNNLDLYREILTKNLGINIEKGKELQSLDAAIAKNQTSINQLQDKIKREGDSNGKKQESIEKLQKENEAIATAKTKLDGVIKSVDTQNGKFDAGQQKLEKVNGQFKNAKQNIDENITRTDVWNSKLDKSHTKKVDIKQSKNPDEENKKWSSPISKTINIIADTAKSLFGYAEGTNYHPGGMAFMGEEGPELFRANGSYGIADFGLYDLPQGAKVWTHDQTKQMLRNGLVDGLSRGVEATQQQINQVHNFNIQPAPIILDGKVIGYATFDVINGKMGSGQSLKGYMRGL